jgi:hypothetical protein
LCNIYYMPVNLLQTKNCTWLLLLYALPTKRTTARVNLWRKLKRFGAVPLKTSAYVLPDEPSQYERFQWLAKEIHDASGEATLIRVAEIEGMTNGQIVGMFNQARTADYLEVKAACRQAMRGRRNKREALAGECARQARRFHEIKEVDYFRSPAADDAEMMLRGLEKLVNPEITPRAKPRLRAADFQGNTWLTRPRPGIDRCGSAWLIRKFIDAKAKFAFASEPFAYPKALPFDMTDVEFSHHGDDCTFETLAKRFGITDKAVLQIAEMVHDADLEDGKFQRTVCIGVNVVLSGWARTKMSDAELLAKGMECFEGLYQQLRK